MERDTRSRKQSLLGMGALALAAVLGISFVLGCRSGPQFSEVQFDQIKPGMTEVVVESILGLPAGDYRPRHWIYPGHYVSTSDAIGFPCKEAGLPHQEIEERERKDLAERGSEGAPFRPKVTWKRWWSRIYGIDVAFDEQGRVIGHHLTEMVPPRDPPDFLGKLRWWLVEPVVPPSP